MKYIIFDFDGTIANTMPHILDMAEELMGIKFTDYEVQKARNMTIKQVIKNYKIPLIKLPTLLVKGRALMGKNIHKVSPVEGFENTLKKLDNLGYLVEVVSSNSSVNIERFLKIYNLNKYFTKIHGNVGVFSKAQALKKVVKKSQIPKEDCIYVGDEVRDVEAAKKAGIKMIAVTWGFNGEKILKDYRPDGIAINPTELIRLIQEL